MKLMPAALSLVLIATTVGVDAQPRTKRIGRVAETSLVGIALYAPGLRVINKFGAPDEILGITLGGSSNAGGGPGAGGGAGDGRMGAPTGGGGAGSASGTNVRTGPAQSDDFIGDPFSNNGWRQIGDDPGMRPGGDGSARSRDDNAAGGGGGGLGMPGGPAGPGGGGGSTTSSTTQFTKWVYKRQNARYSFIIDKYNRVVQIEAIGINDKNVRTSRGVKFGDNFKTLMNKYFQPDSYDLAGDSFVVKFLQRGKVAFRFSRLEPKKPHVITGIVVAAGK